jgi:hypothetical protein
VVKLIRRGRLHGFRQDVVSDVQLRGIRSATTFRPTPKKNLLPLALLFLGLTITLAWNGLLVFPRIGAFRFHFIFITEIAKPGP